MFVSEKGSVDGGDGVIINAGVARQPWKLGAARGVWDVWDQLRWDAEGARLPLRTHRHNFLLRTAKVLTGKPSLTQLAGFKAFEQLFGASEAAGGER